MNQIVIEESCLPVAGFMYAATHSGIKKKKKDLSLIYCPDGAVAAGTFTKNLTKAAPVLVSEKNIHADKVHAIVINSGNANACTGAQGLADALATTELAAELLKVPANSVLVSSTGIIGVPMPMECIKGSLPFLVKHMSKDALGAVAEGIMTTDTILKTYSTTITLSDGVKVTLSGIAKGSGMIHPNMATMLGYVMTDAVIDPMTLKKMTKGIVDQTFNMVTVDGDTSTNDMFIVLASGKAGNNSFTQGSDDGALFQSALKEVSKALSISIAKDGEGASRLLQVKLTGAVDAESARVLAKSVVSSSLVKAAFFGADANWGRIICALGYSGAHFDTEKVNLVLESENGSIELMKDGAGLIFDGPLADSVLAATTIDICITLGDGDASAEAWGCDLTYDYVKINGAYRT